MIEERLKELILTRYKSLREFAQTIDMPNSTMDSIFRRGVNNSSISNVVKICKALRISADELSEGKIVPFDYRDPKKEYTDVNEILDDMKKSLSNYGLTIDGETINKETIDDIINTIDVGVAVAKSKNKKKRDDLH